MSKSFSPGTDRTLALFEAFAETGTPQSLSGLARLMNAPVSTCHGLVRALEARGYLYSLGQSRQIYPTKRLLTLSERIARKDPIVDHAAPTLGRLRDATGETVILGAMQKDAVVYLEVIEGVHVIRYTAKPGDLKPLHSSSIGKLMLGEMPPKTRAAALAALRLERVTEKTITDPAALEAELVGAQATGIYITCGENVAEVMAMAAPFRLSGDVFGIAVAGPIERMTRDADKIRSALLRASAELEATS